MEFFEVRNGLNKIFYLRLVKPILFAFDPELCHKAFLTIGKILNSNILTKKAVSILYAYENKILEQKIFGKKFRNPIGLAAGFDKNAEIIGLMKDVGFGFAEAGSITAKACRGNPGKRLHRIVHKKGLLVNLGLNNRGVDRITKYLKGRKYNLIFGVSVAKTNCAETANDEIGLKDYIYSIKKLKGIGDYLTLNISCPNAYGGQPFSRPAIYEKLLKEISKLKINQPVLVKMSPDLPEKNVDEIIRISLKYKIKGFVCSNLTKEGIKGSGGYSGKIVSKKSDELLAHIYKKTKGKFVLIGAGGVFSAEDAYRKIKLGANLVQLMSGMIFEGPSLIGEINHGLAKLLKKDGFKNIAEAVGKGI